MEYSKNSSSQIADTRGEKLQKMKQQVHDPTSVCNEFIKAAGLQKIETLLNEERYQVIVQMACELLLADAPLAEAFASCFVPESEDQVVRVKKLSTATAAITLFSLIGCRRRAGIALK